MWVKQPVPVETNLVPHKHHLYELGVHFTSLLLLNMYRHILTEHPRVGRVQFFVPK